METRAVAMNEPQKALSQHELHSIAAGIYPS